MAKLTGKQHAFINHYVTCLNATEAARLAGYQGDDATLRSIGSQNLTKLNIREEIDRVLGQQAMSANEVLARLAAQATAELSDFTTVDPRTGFLILDLRKAKERGKLHAIKKLNFGTLGFVKSIELHDQQAALVHLGKAHGLFKDVQEHRDWRTQAIEDIKAGKLPYNLLAEAFDEDLATQLFKQAGVPIEVG